MGSALLAASRAGELRNLDPALLAEVRQHCVMEGNRVVLDQQWWSRKLATAALDGARTAMRQPPRQTWLDALNIPANVARMAHGSEHRERVVARMNKLDRDASELLEEAKAAGDMDADVVAAIAQLLGAYIDNIDALWTAYVRRFEAPLSSHGPWPN